MSSRFRRLGRIGVRAFGALLLLCLVVAAVGYAVGPDPEVRSAPNVDTDERPAKVVADAAAQLHVRDHTWELWLREQNRTTGNVSNGILWRVRVQHSQDRFRIAQWGPPDGSTESVEPTDQPARYGYSRRYAAWGKLPEEDEWRRYSGVEPTYGEKSSAPLSSTSQLRNVPMEIVSENETALVVRTSDERILSALRANPKRGKVTATFTVTKTDDPYLVRYTVRHVTDEEVTVWTKHVSEVGTTTAPEPDGVPAITPMEVIRRTFFGLKSLVA